MSFNPTKNPLLFPRLRRAPNNRSMNSRYKYVPTMITKVDEFPVGEIVFLSAPPTEGDLMCEVTNKTITAMVFWKDLVKL